MKVEVDGNLCTGHGRCWELAGEVYEADDEGFCAQRGSTFEVPAGLEEQARLGAEACPELAIRIVEE